jgi:hypothetical protein
MSAIPSGPPILTSEDCADHYTSNPPTMLVIAMCVAGALFIGALGAGIAYLIRSGRL